MHVQLLEVYLQ